MPIVDEEERQSRRLAEESLYKPGAEGSPCKARDFWIVALESRGVGAQSQRTGRARVGIAVNAGMVVNLTEERL